MDPPDAASSLMQLPDIVSSNEEANQGMRVDQEIQVSHGMRVDQEPVVSMLTDLSELPMFLPHNSLIRNPTEPVVSLQPESFRQGPPAQDYEIQVPVASSYYVPRDFNVGTAGITGNPEAPSPTICTITGVIKKNDRQADKTNLLTVLSNSTNKTYQIVCPFFCPARPNDVLMGYCTQNNGQFRFIRDPVIEPGASMEAIKTTFIIFLGKGQYKQRLADKLYQFFENQARKMILDASKDKTTSKSRDEHSGVLRNKDNLTAAVMEVISLHAQRYRINEETIRPLVQLGLTEKQASNLLIKWYNSFSMRRLYLLGLRWKHIHKACDRGWTPDTLYYQLLENPYVVEKVPMETANSIAQKYELSFDQNMIECAYVVRYIDQQTKKHRWTCYPIYTLIKKFPRFTELQETLKRSYRCRIRYNFIYLHYQAQTEDYLTELLEPVSTDKTYCSEDTQKKLNCQEQIEAVDMALNNRVSVITGGGGSGKTKTIGALCEELELRNERYLVSSFTGKAVARIKEEVPDPELVLTLHMILSRNKIPPITTIIIDEISMAPNELLCRALLRLIELSLFEPVEYLRQLKQKGQYKLRIILVGDNEQLQPIKPGDLFNQILSSGVIPVKYLREDHRRTNQGVLYENMRDYREHKADFIFQFGQNCTFEMGDHSDVITAAHMEFLNGVDHRDITIVCPFGDELELINHHCQEMFLDKLSPAITDVFGKIWKVGSRVMMTENRYDINVMNGDEGIVNGVFHTTKEIQVQFNNGELVRIKTYLPIVMDEESNDGDDRQKSNHLSTKLLVLSWAITIHKSQGSQWRTVIFYHPKNRGSNGFCNKTLAYTGGSRPSETLRVVADTMESFTSMFYVDPPQRYDNLARRLRKEDYVDRYVDPVHGNRRY